VEPAALFHPLLPDCLCHAPAFLFLRLHLGAQLSNLKGRGGGGGPGRRGVKLPRLQLGHHAGHTHQRCYSIWRLSGRFWGGQQVSGVAQGLWAGVWRWGKVDASGGAVRTAPHGLVTVRQ
jgi:hypothetical protein